MTNWPKLGQFPGSFPLGADAVAKAACVPPPANWASREPMLLAGYWHKEISRAFACRRLKTDEVRRRGALSAGATPSHPDVWGAPVQAMNGSFCERVYAIGSVEWAEQQRRQQNGV
jgi:hypothetical protein